MTVVSEEVKEARRRQRQERRAAEGSPGVAGPRLNPEQKAQVLEWLAAGYTYNLISQWMAEKNWPVLATTTLVHYRKQYALQLADVQAKMHSKAMRSGLAIKAERVRRLQEHADQLEQIMWVPDERGRFPNEKAWRETLADIAAEMGDRRQAEPPKTWQDSLVERLKAGTITVEVIAPRIRNRRTLADILARAGLPMPEQPAPESGQMTIEGRLSDD